MVLLSRMSASDAGDVAEVLMRCKNGSGGSRTPQGVYATVSCARTSWNHGLGPSPNFAPTDKDAPFFDESFSSANVARTLKVLSGVEVVGA